MLRMMVLSVVAGVALGVGSPALAYDPSDPSARAYTAAGNPNNDPQAEEAREEPAQSAPSSAPSVASARVAAPLVLFSRHRVADRPPPHMIGDLDAAIARHAALNDVPESLVRRVIKRESGGRPHVVSKGNYGLMQIRLATARGLGYSGTAAGLLDPETNLTYAVRYLAGAFRVARGNHDRAVSYYASGYYYAAKRMKNVVEANALPGR